MSEEWRAIPGWEGVYEVSDLGRVKSLARTVSRGLKSMQIREHLLPGSINVAGYRVYVLTRDGSRKSFYGHALVMLAFVGPLPRGMHTRHLDGNPQNNVRSNLLYGTPSENAYDKVRHGRDVNAAKTHCKRGHEFTPENTMRHKDGRRECRICHEANARAYREEHAEKLRANNRAYHAENRDERNAKRAAYDEDHRERQRAYNKAYREANRERLLAQSRAAHAANKDERNAKRAQYDLDHRERQQAYSKAYYASHKKPKPS